MGTRNYTLESDILKFVAMNGGLNRGKIATGLQKLGMQFGKQHIINRTSQLVATGALQERQTADGRRLVYPVQEAPAEL
jgi:hypothetical protein